MTKEECLEELVERLLDDINDALGIINDDFDTNNELVDNLVRHLQNARERGLVIFNEIENK